MLIRCHCSPRLLRLTIARPQSISGLQLPIAASPGRGHCGGSRSRSTNSATGGGGAAGGGASNTPNMAEALTAAKKRMWEVAYAAEPLPIVKAGDPVLRQPALEVPADWLGSEELHRLVEAMVAAMRAAPGVGLAAPQIGVPLQVAVLEDREEYIARLPPGEAERMGRAPFPPLALVNPRLSPLGSEGARFFEGCLSVPGYQALVERYGGVRCDALTPDGAPVRFEARGWQARILQHECDHLAGVLYIDRMLSRSFSTREAVEAKLLPDDVPAPGGTCACTHTLP